MDVQQARQLFQYDPETGHLYWRMPRYKVCDSLWAGYPNSSGYLQVKVSGRKYCVHRLAWLMTHGQWPEGQLDHTNGNRLDNRLVNLRIVTPRQNSQNRTTHRAGRLVGCSYHKQRRLWRAYITVRRKQRSLGYYETEQEAHEAYLCALQNITKECDASGYASSLEAVRSVTNSKQAQGDLS